uniref:Uncharacterized protein n=1 Tax=Timema bartmani TaxID=61472 RepID=A0A7R9F3D4_9NEOP|nr:unnamed protein product [Timema bartmani]
MSQRLQVKRLKRSSLRGQASHNTTQQQIAEQQTTHELSPRNLAWSKKMSGCHGNHPVMYTEFSLTKIILELEHDLKEDQGGGKSRLPRERERENKSGGLMEPELAKGRKIKQLPVILRIDGVSRVTCSHTWSQGLVQGAAAHFVTIRTVVHSITSSWQVTLYLSSPVKGLTWITPSIVHTDFTPNLLIAACMSLNLSAVRSSRIGVPLPFNNFFLRNTSPLTRCGQKVAGRRKRLGMRHGACGHKDQSNMIGFTASAALKGIKDTKLVTCKIKACMLKPVYTVMFSLRQKPCPTDRPTTRLCYTPMS